MGLTERELPQDQCVSMNIPWLCVGEEEGGGGGGGVTFENKGNDILMCMRGDKGTDTCRYQVYRNELLLPFIRETWK